MVVLAQPAHKPAPARQDAARRHGGHPAAQRLMATGRMLNAGTPVVAQRALGAQLSRGANAPVIQAKLHAGRTPVLPEQAEGASRVVSSLILSKDDYVLRGDCKLTDEAVHVINRGHKYLLGEFHDTDQWDKRIEHWDVDTMVEGAKDFPEIERPIEDEHAPRKDQVLESIYAAATRMVLQWRTSFDLWRQTWSQWEEHRKPPPEITEEQLELELLELMKETGNEETKHELVSTSTSGNDEETVEDTHLDSSFTIDAIIQARSSGAIALKQIEKWSNEILKIFHEFDTEKSLVGKSVPFDFVRKQLDFAKYERALQRVYSNALRVQEIDDDKERISILETGFNAVNGVGGNLAHVFTQAARMPKETAKEVVARAEGKVKIGKGDESRLTSPIREEAMIRNIKAARAPLFVRMGDNHVAPVHEKVSESIPVPRAADFAAMTLAAEGKIPNV